jgi:glycosyltransferase involved in cell wall biosynthesis
MPNKILFVKKGSFSLINNSIHKILQNEFPGQFIDVIDVDDILKHNISYLVYAKNIYYFFKEYGKDFIYRYKKKNEMFQWFFATSYIALTIDKCLQEIVKGKKYQFSFQTQTIFNGKIKGIPHFIYTDHTTKTNFLYPDINPRQYIRSNAFVEKSEKMIYRDADMIFTCGSLITYSLLTQYNIESSKVLTAFAGSNAKNGFIQNDSKYLAKNILFVGVDWERKGGPILLEVFEKVLIRHSDATLTIVGCSPNGVSLPNCSIIGKIPAEKLAKYYNAATIFCLPTLREPFGIVFVEAMHYKLPIIANNIGSIPDMVINDFNGYLIDNNVDDYVNHICKLFDNPTVCKEFGENGYRHAQTKFSWEQAGKAMKAKIIQYVKV